MKRILLVLAVLLILMLAASYQNNNNTRLILSNLIYSNYLKSGDLVYQINLFNIIPVAEAIFYRAVEDEYAGKKSYHLKAKAKTIKPFAKFFNAYVILDSYIDRQQHTPFVFRQKIHVPEKPEIDKEILYDQLNGQMTLDGETRAILPQTYEPLSVMYYLRNADFLQNKEVDININTNQKNYALTGTVKPQQINIDNKKYELLILNSEIKRRDKNPHHKSKVKITFLKDNENIPILVRVFASGMFINVKLVRVE